MTSKSKQYNNAKLKTDIFGIIYNLFLLYILGFTSISVILEQKLVKNYDLLYISGYIVFILSIFLILNFGLELYQSYILEKKYDLSNENLKKWGLKYLKNIALTLSLGATMILVIYYFIVFTEKFWYIYAFLFIVLLNLIIGILAPVVILPLFYKFKPIDNPELKENLEIISKKVGINLNGVYQFDMSKETKKANAAFLGFGKSKRIILGDTLLESLSTDAIVSVFAHEIGHYKKKHIMKIMLLNIVILALLFYTVSYISIDKTNSGEVMLLNIFKVVFIFMMSNNILMAFQNFISRKYEYEADNYAKKIIGTEKYLVIALKKLQEQNLGDDNPNKIVEFIFYSHPSVKKRIENLES